VFEGVVDKSDYSTSNYYDNRSLNLRYPEQFAKEVKNNIDFVTLAMNHIMDGDSKDVDYTIDTFNNIGLDYTGAYNLQEDYDNITIVDIDGLSVAILAYTDFVNYTSDINSYTVKFLEYDTVIHDIELAKSENVDLIITMPHLGTQFNHKINERQKYWNNIFASNGVDIVLADHPHVVEPIQYINDTTIINCPGNYYTSLSGEDQEYGAICNLYIDKTSKKVITTSVVPIKSVVTETSGTVVPLYDINDINGTNLVLNNMINIEVNSLLTEYYYSKDGYCKYYDDSNTENTNFFGDKKVCFIGDSITEGTKNNGHGWYEYVTSNYIDVSKGGATSEDILDLLEDNVLDADVYVVAIGCNDIRYYNINVEDYMENIESIADILSNNDAELYFISPWYTLKSDNNSILSYSDRNSAIEVYNSELSTFCSNKGYHFINMYSDLKDFFESCGNDRLYMVDGVHPNATTGIKLYSDIFVKNVN
jgi:lysophospholipase L1-like esterase